MPTPLWVKDAIISNENDDDEYYSVNDAWNTCEHEEYATAGVVEDQANAPFFERVYKIDKQDGSVEYHTSALAKEWLHSQYKG